jgi:hypothetical protein
VIRVVWVYIIFFSPFWVPCNSKQKSGPAEIESSAPVMDTIPKVKTDVVDFSSQVQPILVTRCSPCHFPGGKMYGRMPFDQDTTILSHEAGILRRIKDEKENALIRTFINQQLNSK